MDDLTYTLRQLCQRNRDSSHNTQADRMRSLALAARQLREAGFRQMKASSLKGKHVQALLDRWQGEGLSSGTIKNRLSHLRWWAEKIGKSGILPADNMQLGVAERRYVTNVSKARELGTGLEQITDVHVRMSLQLQAAFGLRREEAIKFQPSYADRGDHIAPQGIVDQGRSGANCAHHHDRATRRAPRSTPPGGHRITDPGKQDLHPAAARLRWTMQGGESEPYAWPSSSVRAKPL